MAGRAAGQLGLLDQQRRRVQPARGQVVGDAAAGDPAADHHHLRSIVATGPPATTGLDHFIVGLPSPMTETPRTRRTARPRARAGRPANGRASWPAASRTPTTRWSSAAAPTWCGCRPRTPGMLAIDRENEYLNTVAAADAGVGAAVIDYVPERSLLVLEFIEGETQSAEALQRGDKLEWVADACRRLHGARRFRDDFNMFRIQRRYLTLVQERGFRLPERYLEFEPQVRRIERGDGRARRGHGALQQRPAGRELHRRRRLVPADRLRVLGQQRRLLRAGQRLERVQPLARSARRAGRPLLRPATCATRSPGRGCGG